MVPSQQMPHSTQMFAVDPSIRRSLSTVGGEFKRGTSSQALARRIAA
jgi:hypothetical protein